MAESRQQPANRAEHVKYCCDRGMSLLRAKRLDEAMAEFNDALRHNPACPDAIFGMGECLASRGRIDDAMGRYLECLQNDPGHVPAHFSLGNVYLTKGKINEAMRHFTIVRLTDPEHVMARFNIGKCLEKKGQIEDALANYRSITVTFPQFLDGYLAAALCQISLGKVKDAVEVYRKVIAMAPARMDIRHALISLLEREGLFEQAIAEYRSIIALKPGNYEVYLDMASAMDRGGMIKEAIEVYAQVLKMKPDNAFAFTKRRILIREWDKIDQLTDRYLGHVINKMDKIGDRFREGMKLYLDGCYDYAQAEFDQAVAAAPSPEAYFGNGACHVRMGRLLAAIPMFREAIKLNAEFPEAHTMLGILYERHGLIYESSIEYDKGVKEVAEKVRARGGESNDPGKTRNDPSYRFYSLD